MQPADMGLREMAIYLRFLYNFLRFLYNFLRNLCKTGSIAQNMIFLDKLTKIDIISTE